MPIVDASGPLPDAGDSAVYKDKSQSTVLTVRRHGALSPFDLVVPDSLTSFGPIFQVLQLILLIRVEAGAIIIFNES